MFIVSRPLLRRPFPGTSPEQNRPRRLTATGAVVTRTLVFQTDVMKRLVPIRFLKYVGVGRLLGPDRRLCLDHARQGETTDHKGRQNDHQDRNRFHRFSSLRGHGTTLPRHRCQPAHAAALFRSRSRGFPDRRPVFPARRPRKIVETRSPRVTRPVPSQSRPMNGLKLASTQIESRPFGAT